MSYDSVQKLSYRIEGKDTIYYDTPASNEVLMDRISPVFVGNMKDFIKDNLVYPEEARKRKLEGYVNLYCPIDSNGIPTNVLVLYSSSPLFDKEAERIVRLMRWKWDKRETFKEKWAEHVQIVFKL